MLFSEEAGRRTHRAETKWTRKRRWRLEIKINEAVLFLSDCIVFGPGYLP
jgi:hypothetical protein